jgi:glyoxylase-like metal-dependent hydrolase (beta-lactamase superfamily II)
MNFKTIISLAAFAASSAFAQDYAKMEVTPIKLNDTTWVLSGAGTNLALSVGPDAVFIVDDNLVQMSPAVRAAIAKVTDRPVRFVFNTHWHYDHVGGNEMLGKEGATIVAHENVRKRMSTEQFMEFLNERIKASPAVALPVVTFTSDMAFHLNGEEISVFHVARAHTDGDAIVHFKKGNIVHMGDVYNRSYPFIDTSAGGTIDGVIAAIDHVIGRIDDKTLVIPGHGKRANKADLVEYRNMLATIGGRLKGMMKEGKTLEQAIAAQPTKEFDDKWKSGFLPPERFVKMVWQNLAATK